MYVLADVNRYPVKGGRFEWRICRESQAIMATSDVTPMSLPCLLALTVVMNGLLKACGNWAEGQPHPRLRILRGCRGFCLKQSVMGALYTVVLKETDV